MRDIRRSAAISASKLFHRYGCAKTTMEDIARDVGVSKATLYNYFHTKDNIVISVLDNEESVFLETMRLAIAGASSPIESFVAFYKIYAATARRGKQLFFLCKDNYIWQRPVFTKNLQSRINVEKRILQTIFVEGMSLEVFRSFTNIEEIIDMLYTVLHSFCRGFSGGKSTRNFETKLDTLVELLLVGICLEKVCDSSK